MKLYTIQDYANPTFDHVSSETQDIAVQESRDKINLGLDGKLEHLALKNTARGSVII